MVSKSKTFDMGAGNDVESANFYSVCDFIDGIGKENLISVNTIVQKGYPKDNIVVIVWYWEE